MKSLSVTQPWASVICSGIKDVENRKWQSAEAPGRILIHATKTKVPRNWENCPDDYISSVKNARLMGQIPEYKDMPYGSVIGYVDCYDIVKDSQSYWAQPDSFHWCLRDAYLFDEPIPGVDGVRGHLFDVAMDENNLPAAHKVEILVPAIKGDTLIMPASTAVMEQVEAGEKEFCYDMDVLFSQIFLNKKGELIQPKHVRFVRDGQAITKDLKGIDWIPYLDGDDKTITYIGFDGNVVEWSFVDIVIR